ncbi:sulfatase-like hydrolase/transferase [Helicobacter sp. 12S02232-10]|uniref:phosphoethanolamine transferase n=1 Tax=Helicobacter sp. 12S02232-10 TaxID=1476197 RepID=UPI0015DF7A5B|nr:sulfatase-like hydrolase/transferase [Helicobacter sp. 12S02232-10]
MKNIFSHYFSYHWIIFLFSVILVGFYNDVFWLKIYSYVENDKKGDYFFVAFLFVAYVLIVALAIELLSVRLIAKWIIGILIVIAGVSQYYMKSLDITINNMVMESLLHTNLTEIRDFLTLGLFWFLIAYVILPICLLYFIKLKPYASFFHASCKKLGIIILYIAIIGGLYFYKGGDIIFAFKSSKVIIYTTNPIAPIRSSVHLILDLLKPLPHFVYVGMDARLKPTRLHPEIFVLVIGESARAANFSLDGYDRNTNPYMEKLDSLVNFTNFYSCGVITAISIPCMLTNYTHQTYKSRNQALYIDNILDIAQRVGYETYWISNNGGGCMGDVCARIKNVKYYNDGRLDGAMLEEIEDLIKNAKKDSFIVLNLHGSHGASYYERYPKNFEFFSPVCRQKELQKCSHESLVNAYDNSIIYTDYLLYQIVQALDKNKKFSSAMWYLSDHGESLGEYGQYMHGGLPYAISPDVQKHIPSMIWLGKGFEADYKKLIINKDKLLNQDYLFHTLLDLLDIQTKDYQKGLDIAN